MNAGEVQFNRTPIYIALGLSILLVLGVLVGAKVVYEKAAKQPVAMSTIDAPDASSPECSAFIDALPEKLLGHKRAGIAEPAPEGAAAFASNSQERATVRCGVFVPFQYNALAEPVEVDGVKWLQIIDATPGSTMQTWYSVSSTPTVAVSVDEAGLRGETNPVTELGDAMKKLTGSPAELQPTPLAGLEAASTDSCGGLIAALPEKLGADYTRVSADRVRDAGLPEFAAAWTAPGKEEVVLRCGVADAPGYSAGAQLQQVDSVPWFQDTTLANGTTSGTWYALGRKSNVAASIPQSLGNTAIVAITDAIAKNIPAK